MGAGNRVEVTAGFCILWAMMILTLPLKFLLAAMTAAMIHEVCHILAVWFTGGRILGFTLGAGGLTMDVAPMPPGVELICALAGPGGSLLLGLAPVPELAVCGLIQGLFNLIPLMPMDGGRALGCLLELTVPGHQGSIQNTLEFLVLGVLMGLILVFRAGLAGFGVWMLLVMRKFPCKPWGKAVQ